MRRITVLLSLALGPLTAACADQSSLGPSQLEQVEQVDDNSLAAAKGDVTTSGKKVGGSAGGVKGKGR